MIVVAFFQPVRNLQMLKSLGVTHFTGPEVENAGHLAPADLLTKQKVWIDSVGNLGCKCILKNPPPILPPHCDGVMMTVDEPNGHSVLPSALKPESDKLRATYPSKPIWLSLAGDKILDVKTSHSDYLLKVKLYQDYTALVDVLTTDFYSRNRNARTYPDTHPGDVVKNLTSWISPLKRVIPWLEMNDQQLSPPKPSEGFNRAPFADEIKDQWSYAKQMGAAGVGWFATCDSGKYGWGIASPDFPTKGDSYWPLVGRNGASMSNQISMVETISKSLNPPSIPSAPTVEERLTALEKAMAAISTAAKI